MEDKNSKNKIKRNTIRISIILIKSKYLNIKIIVK